MHVLVDAEVQLDRRISRSGGDSDNRLALAFGAIRNWRNSLIQSLPPAC
jgi:hypothetical protein